MFNNNISTSYKSINIIFAKYKKSMTKKCETNVSIKTVVHRNTVLNIVSNNEIWSLILKYM